MTLNYKSSLVRYRRYLQVAAQKPLWKASLFLSLSLILVVVLMVIAIRPTAMKIAELQGKVQSQRELSNRLNEKIMTSQKAAMQLELVRPRLSILTQGLPVNSEWKEWEIKLENMATQAGVKLETVMVGAVQIKGNEAISQNKASVEKSMLPPEVVGVRVNLQATGQYNQLVDFIRVLEKTRRIVVLSSAEINKQKDGSLQLTVSGDIGYISKYSNL